MKNELIRIIDHVVSTILHHPYHGNRGIGITHNCINSSAMIRTNVLIVV